MFRSTAFCPHLRWLLLAVAAFLGASEPAPWPGTRVVFQAAVSATAANGKPVTAYLWMPPASPRLRGLMIGGTILAEGGIAANPAVRAACAEADLGIVLFRPHLDAVFASATSGPILERILADLAVAAQAPEIAGAPLIPFGHSVGTIWTRNLLFWKPGRCLAGIFYKGGFGVPDGHRLDELAGIPLLHIQGRFEEFGPGPSGSLRKDQGEDRSTGGRAAMAQLTELRRGEPRFLMGLVIEDGATHFTLSQGVADHIAGFVRAASRLRRPQVDGPLVAVDPATGTTSPAGDFFADAPDATASFWHPNPDLAAAVIARNRWAHGRLPQFVSYADGKGRPIAVANDMRMKLQPIWSGPDTASVSGTFCTTAPTLYPAVEGPITHGEGPVRFGIFAGPLEQIGPLTFRVTMDTRLGERGFVVAYHPGDDQHRYAEQPGNLRVPLILKGATQSITAPMYRTIPASALPLTLEGTSDQGLPVRFHVDHGPARVVDGKLELADVPARFTGPLEITLVAWQYGSAVKPLIASAEPVTQVIRITR